MSTIRAVFVLVVELQLSVRTAHTSHVGPVTRYTLTNNNRRTQGEHTAESDIEGHLNKNHSLEKLPSSLNLNFDQQRLLQILVREGDL